MLTTWLICSTSTLPTSPSAQRLIWKCAISKSVSHGKRNSHREKWSVPCNTGGIFKCATTRKKGPSWWRLRTNSDPASSYLRLSRSPNSSRLRPTRSSTKAWALSSKETSCLLQGTTSKADARSSTKGPKTLRAWCGRSWQIRRLQLSDFRHVIRRLTRFFRDRRRLRGPGYKTLC